MMYIRATHNSIVVTKTFKAKKLKIKKRKEKEKHAVVGETGKKTKENS